MLSAGALVLAAMGRSGGDATIAHQGPADVFAQLAEALDLVEGGRDAAIDLILPVAEVRIHQLHQLLGAADAGVVRPALEGIRLVERKFRLHGVDDLLHRGDPVGLSAHCLAPLRLVWGSHYIPVKNGANHAYGVVWPDGRRADSITPGLPGVMLGYYIQSIL